MKAVEEFAEFLQGNFIHIYNDMFYIMSYDVNMNRFTLVSSDESQFNSRFIYLHELMLTIEREDYELYIKFKDKFPEYFI